MIDNTFPSHWVTPANTHLCLQNGTVKSTEELVKTLNAGSIGNNVGTYTALNTANQPEAPMPVSCPCTSIACFLRQLFHMFSADVVVAPTFVHIPSVKASLTNSISVAAQNCWVKGTGAYTGEIR